MCLSLLSQMKTVSYKIYDVVRAYVSTLSREYAKRRHNRCLGTEYANVTFLCQIQLGSFLLKLL